ncbi:MAG: hypothetical protein ACOYXR_04390 [Nitrospirota bacterium]
MKAILSTLSSVIILVLGWVLMATILAVIGIIASRARPEVGVFPLVNIFLMWVLSPGVGGFFAVYVTALLFRSVPISTIYVSFVSVAAVLVILFFIYDFERMVLEGSGIGKFLIFVLQSGAIFLGALAGKTFVNDVRE